MRNKLLKELEEREGILYRLKKNRPTDYPDGYFDILPDRIIQRKNEQELNRHFVLPKSIPAVAASLILILLSYWSINEGEKTFEEKEDWSLDDIDETELLMFLDRELYDLEPDLLWDYSDLGEEEAIQQ